MDDQAQLSSCLANQTPCGEQTALQSALSALYTSSNISPRSTEQDSLENTSRAHCASTNPRYREGQNQSTSSAHYA